MIDLHCHILPGVDDGAKNIEESIQILRKAVNAGFDTICFTPHYAQPQYINTKLQNQEILENVKSVVKDENLAIKVLLGNEIFITNHIEELLQNGKITTLAESNYALIEVPMYQEMPQEIIQEMLDSVKKSGFKVVIAHPERYKYIQKNPKKLLEYFGDDVIFQGNYASIIGAYGKDAQKTIKKFLKLKIINYLSSDVHQVARCFYDNMEEIKKKLLKVVDKEYLEILTTTNPKRIIENEEIIKFK